MSRALAGGFLSTDHQGSPVGVLYVLRDYFCDMSCKIFFNYIIVFFFFPLVAVPCGMWNFPYQGLNPCLLQWKQSRNRWTTREVPVPLSFDSWIGLPFEKFL